MAETKEKVMEMVRAELDKNPDAETAKLYEKAQKVDKSVKDLTLRQFHARYPLQVKRKKAAKAGRTRRGGRRRGRRGKEPDREAIRDSLLGFAKEVSKAEGAAQVIDALGTVDKYVDKIVKAVQ